MSGGGLRSRYASKGAVAERSGEDGPTGDSRGDSWQRSPSNSRYCDVASSPVIISEGPRSSNEFRLSENESPRQVSFGLALLMSLIWLAAYDIDDPRPGAAACQKGMWGCLLFFLVYSALNTRDGMLERPHPVLWRLLHGWNLWYCTLVVVLFVVPPTNGKQIMDWIFHQADRPPKELVIGSDHLACQINQANVLRQLFGIWFFAHCVGWWAKMLMLRNLRMCLVYSTCFELLELTLQCIVPEFQECWWDSIIMDWLISNLLIGMMLGVFTLNLLKAQLFAWAPQRNFRLIKMFMPGRWSEYKWNPGHDPVTMVLNHLIWMVMAVGELNSFFIMTILDIKRDHPFNMLRQAMLCLTAVNAVEEWYEYTRHSRMLHLSQGTFLKEREEYERLYKGRKPRIGHYTWLLAITVVIEVMTIVRYTCSLGQVKAITPGPELWAPWASWAALFSIYFAIHCWFFYRKQRVFPIWLRVLKYVSFLPLLSLTRLYAF